jgi:hypothetical protein
VSWVYTQKKTIVWKKLNQTILIKELKKKIINLNKINPAHTSEENNTVNFKKTANININQHDPFFQLRQIYILY